MNATSQTTTHDHYATRIMRFGFVAGLACMVALFIAGLVQGSAGMTVMASSTAALLGATWTANSVAARKKAQARA